MPTDTNHLERLHARPTDHENGGRGRASKMFTVAISAGDGTTKMKQIPSIMVSKHQFSAINSVLQDASRFPSRQSRHQPAKSG